MDVTTLIKQQVAFARRVSDGVLADLTDEQLNWTPPGTANPIRALLMHVLSGEDGLIQARLQGKPRLWETGGWAEKIGLSAPPGREKGWDEVKTTPLALAPVLAYQRAVRAATDGYLEGLTAEELDRQVELLGSQRSVAAALSFMVVHSLGHLGEIAALKGIQGARGLPF